jgi:pimeloyl-ACP methyl ester carboxylesterase
VVDARGGYNGDRLMPADAIFPPSPLLTAFEGRAWLELASVVPALPILDRAPTGDGHPVLVIPGWLAGDISTRTLRWFLRRRGYHVHGWRLGRNVGATSAVVEGLGKRFRALRVRHGRRLSVVGWSLGGLYARELARRFPDDVRQVITLGSPFADPSATVPARLYRALYGGSTSRRVPPHEPLPVPATSIYSRSDGVVAWRSCLDAPGPQRENIEVWSSHCGLGHHPAALLVIADRLAQPEGAWRPFVPRSWHRWPLLAARAG